MRCEEHFNLYICNFADVRLFSWELIAPGWVAPAYRFVNALTGQEVAIIRFGGVEVAIYPTNIRANAASNAGRSAAVSRRDVSSLR